MPLCDHVRPGSLHRVDRPTEVHAPILIKIIKGGVLEWLASADTSVVHEKVDSPEMLDGHRDQVTAALRGGNITVTRDCLASARPDEVGHLFRYPGVLPEPRYVGPQVVHHDPGTAFGEKFDVRPPQPAACPSHNRDLPLQRNSFGHLAILLWGTPECGRACDRQVRAAHDRRGQLSATRSVFATAKQSRHEPVGLSVRAGGRPVSATVDAG